MRVLDLAGKRFNGFTVLYEVPSKNGRSRWMCRCNCGNEWVTDSCNIKQARMCPKCARSSCGKRMFTIPNCGKRLLDVINSKDISLQALSDSTGVSRSSVHAFIYCGRDLSSMRLARVCGYCGVTMDYIMGLKEAE